MNATQLEDLAEFLLVIGAFVAAYLFALAVHVAAGVLRFSMPDAIWIALCLILPYLAIFRLFDRRSFAGYRNGVRITLSAVLSVLLALSSWWLAFITIGGGDSWL